MGFPRETLLRTGTVRISCIHEGVRSKNRFRIRQNSYHIIRVMWQIRYFVPPGILKKSKIANKGKKEDFFKKIGHKNFVHRINEITLLI